MTPNALRRDFYCYIEYNFRVNSRGPSNVVRNSYRRDVRSSAAAAAKINSRRVW